MKRRWVILSISCLALIGAGILVRTERKNRQLAKRAVAYRVRAEQGDAKSQSALAAAYYYGDGVSKDYVEAAHWYLKAAEQGNINGQVGISSMYFDGKGVPQDRSESARWCRKAAEQGDAQAQYGLGIFYARGQGVPQDYGEAVRWYRKSSDQGYPKAQYALGFMLYHGYGVQRDRVQAHDLFEQAAAHGNEDAQRATGSTRSHPAMSKFMLPWESLGSLCIALMSFKVGKSHRTRLRVAALLLMCSFVMDLFWYSYLGHVQSSTTTTELYLARHLVGGVIFAFGLSIVFPRSARAALMIATALFISSIVFRIVICELRHAPVTIRLLCFAGLPLGMALTSAVFLWLDYKRHAEMRTTP